MKQRQSIRTTVPTLKSNPTLALTPNPTYPTNPTDPKPNPTAIL